MFHAAAPAAADKLPEANARVLQITASYEPGSHGGYSWPAPKGTHGMTRDLFLGGQADREGQR